MSRVAARIELSINKDLTKTWKLYLIRNFPDALAGSFYQGLKVFSYRGRTLFLRNRKIRTIPAANPPIWAHQATPPVAWPTVVKAKVP